MANWSTENTRNIYISEASTANRAFEVLSFFDHHLCEGSAGWTRLGSGTGTGGSFTWGTTKTLPTYPSIVGMTANPWSAWRNASGAELCLQVDNNGFGYSWWSPVAGFVATGINETTPPSLTGTPPADMLTQSSGANVQVGRDRGYITMAYSDDQESFITFGRRPTVDEFAFCFIKLEDTKTGDLQPYWTYIRVASGANVWVKDSLALGTTAWNLGYHPLTGQQVYNIPELYAKFVYPMDNLPSDPISGNIQMIESLCLCATAASYHIRGKIPGINRVSSTLGTGDRINHLGAGVYEYVVIGEYCVPWNSSDAMIW